MSLPGGKSFDCTTLSRLPLKYIYISLNNSTALAISSSPYLSRLKK